MLFLEKPHFYDPGLFDNDPLMISSVGVLVYTGEIAKGGSPSFILVEQADQPGKPWGIPAGHVEDNENDPRQTAVREVKEETGMEIEGDRLQEWLLGLMWGEEMAQIVYSYQASSKDLEQIGKWSWARGTRIVKPKDKKRKSAEIGTVALIPANEMFDRGHPLIKSYYRWDHMHEIKAKLEGLRVI